MAEYRSGFILDSDLAGRLAVPVRPARASAAPFRPQCQGAAQPISAVGLHWPPFPRERGFALFTAPRRARCSRAPGARPPRGPAVLGQNSI